MATNRPPVQSPRYLRKRVQTTASLVLTRFATLLLYARKEPTVTRRAQHFREEAAEFFWPTRCVGCNMPGALLCPSCEEELPWIDQRWSCPLCGAPYGWLTCTECDRSRDNDAEGEPQAHEEQLRAHWPARAAICAFPFDGTPAHMVTLLKDAHELRLAPLMAGALVRALEDARDVPALDGRPRFASEDIDAVCFVPATPAAYARRGFDHMELVATPLAQKLGLPLADVLARADARDQRLLGKEARAANLSGNVAALDDLTGLRLLLVDDVITTGSSIAAATHALLARGAREVTACAFARVW